MEKMEKIKIGKIVSAVGLKGEVKIYSYAGSKERYESLARLIVAAPGRGASDERDSVPAPGRGAADERSSAPGPGRGEKEYAIENVRYQKEMVIVKLAGVSDRNQAEALRESEVFITEDDLEELPADTFYIRDLLGCRVLEAESGRELGTLSDVIQNSAHDLYQVELADGRQALIPAVGQFIAAVDPAQREIRVRLIPGLLD